MPWIATCYECQQETEISRPYFETKDDFLAWTLLKRTILEKAVAVEEYQDKALRGLKCKRIQCDEIWAFVYAKSKNVPEAHKGEFGYGDVWTWTALCADCKLLPSWAVGRRDGFTASAFIRDLADRLAVRVQLTTDGHKPYLEAVEGAFGNDIDYAMLVKMYEGDSAANAPAQRRYSPAVWYPLPLPAGTRTNT